MRTPNWIKVGTQFSHEMAPMRVEIEKLAITTHVSGDNPEEGLTVDLSGDWPTEAVCADIISAARKAGIRRVWIDDECFVVRTGESCLTGKRVGR